jgi:dsRNA-specific ribonuclease
MKVFLSALVLISATFFAMQAAEAAHWECTYSCGSKGQEAKTGRGWSQNDAIRDARRHTCHKYEGGQPKYYQGCQYVDDSRGGGDHDGGWNPPGRQQWQCVFACGSKGQEQKVGYGRSPREASRQAQRQICTKYEGGYPKYYVGCQAQ